MKYPKTIKFRVLQRDIDKAVRASKKNYSVFNICRECIIAQAAKRVFKSMPSGFFISVGIFYISIINKETGRTEVYYPLSSKLKSYTKIPTLQWSEAKPSKSYILTKRI